MSIENRWKPYETKLITHENIEYEVRVFSSATALYAMAFRLDGEPANRYYAWLDRRIWILLREEGYAGRRQWAIDHLVSIVKAFLSREAGVEDCAETFRASLDE